MEASSSTMKTTDSCALLSRKGARFVMAVFFTKGGGRCNVIPS